jgi:MFS family permease
MISDKSPSAKSGESSSPPNAQPWYAGVTSYQWLILAIASASWIFDVYQGQIFGITGTQLLQSVLDSNDPARIKFWKDVFFGIFLVGGAIGGLLFGMMADRWGRKPTLIATILMYSVFTGLTYFAHTLWPVAILRFLIALGTGGAWAVAASLVSEVFPARARTYASGIFHASSVLGTWTATFVGILVADQWGYAYLVGVIPAFLVIWVIVSVKEPQRWKQSADESVQKPKEKAGSLVELLGDRRWRKRAILGMILATVGLSCYWGVHVAGLDLAYAMLVKHGVAKAVAMERAKPAYGYVEVAGGLAGLLSFGPLCARFGRKRAFFWSQLAACLIVPVTCYLPQTYGQLLCILPVFGFLTLGMHAGYAIYFPELFPTRLRATGTAFCFNVGRVLAASMMVYSGWLKARMDIHLAVSLLGCLFLLGLIVIYFMPETKGQPLPE